MIDLRIRKSVRWGKKIELSQLHYAVIFLYYIYFLNIKYSNNLFYIKSGFFSKFNEIGIFPIFYVQIYGVLRGEKTKIAES